MPIWLPIKYNSLPVRRFVVENLQIYPICSSSLVRFFAFNIFIRYAEPLVLHYVSGVSVGCPDIRNFSQESRRWNRVDRCVDLRLELTGGFSVDK